MPRAQSGGIFVAGSISDKTGFFEKPVAGLFFVLLVTFLAYSNTFGVPFQFDDAFNIVENPLIKDLSNIPSLFLGSKGPFASRPLMHATLALNYYFGGLDTWGYHVVNLAIHMINGVLLYLLVVLTGRRIGYAERVVRWAALLASALFLLHPVQTEAVTYIVSRSMLLATMFYLAGMILFLRAVTAEQRKGLWVAGLFATSLLGMASREDFATFPVMLVLYDLFFISELRFREAMRHWKAYLPVFLSLGYMAFLLLNNTYSKSADFAGLGVPAVNYLFTQFKVHWTYLRLLVLPLNQNLDYDYPIAWNYLEFRAILSLAGYLGLWAVVILFARKRPVLSFSLLWFLVTLIPISFGVTLTNLALDDVIFEHRLYLAGAGLIVAAASGAVCALDRIPKGRLRRALIVVTVLVPLALAMTAHARNSVWASDVSLWADTADKSPRKGRPQYNLGNAYKARGLYDKAIESYVMAIKLYPQYAAAHNNLGSVLGERGNLRGAVEHFESAIAIKPDFAAAHFNLGLAYSMLGRNDMAIEHFLKVVEIDPYYIDAYINLGIAYASAGLQEKAEEQLRRARELSSRR